MAVPGQRKPGQRGGSQRGNTGTFRKSGGRVPPPPKRPTVSGKGKSGCAMVVAVPALIVGLAVLAACQLG